MPKARGSTPSLLDPTTLVTDVAIDDDHIIVSTIGYGDPPLFMIRHDGTERRDLIPDGGPRVSRVVADARGIVIACDRGVCRIDKAGSLVELAPHNAWGLTVDEDHAYGSVLGSYPDYNDGGVFRVPRGGGKIEWLVRGRSVSALCVHADRLLFIADKMLHVRAGTADVRALAPTRNPHAIAVVRDTICWSEFDQEGSPRAFDGQTVRALDTQPYTSGMVARGDWLYWAQSHHRSRSKPAIWRMRLADEKPEPVAKFANKSLRLAANAHLLTWVGDLNGGVHALPI